MKKIRILNRIANGLFVILMIIVIPLSIPKIFGYSTYSVLSESMEPAISTGSLIYVQGTDVIALKPGDVITFYGKQSSIVTHRIVSIENQVIITKGDHNQDNDLGGISYSQLIGKVVFSIPVYGYIYTIFGNIGGICLFLIILFVIIGMWLKASRMQRG